MKKINRKYCKCIHISVTKVISIICLLSILGSCEKEIEFDLPDATPKLVVEGRIEQGNAPYVMLSKSVGYFEPTDIAAIESQFVHGAVVTITVDNATDTLEEICLNDIPLQFLPMVAEFIGIPEDELGNVNYCIYTVPIIDLIIGNYLKGEVGKSYKLTIISEENTYTAVTKIPELVPLDSVWYETEGSGNDQYGFLYAHLSDPDTLGNAYRWFAKRINLKPDGEPKDNNFVAPFGSAFDDQFFNGKSFEFGYDRGDPPNSEPEPGEKNHYFKEGDTIVVKFCTIDLDHYKFLRIFELEVNSNGNPFASPTTTPTNVTGGALGIWGGYGATFDTLVATD